MSELLRNAVKLIFFAENLINQVKETCNYMEDCETLLINCLDLIDTILDTVKNYIKEEISNERN